MAEIEPRNINPADGLGYTIPSGEAQKLPSLKLQDFLNIMGPAIGTKEATFI